MFESDLNRFLNLLASSADCKNNPPLRQIDNHITVKSIFVQSIC